jgi:hypothetical protein
MKFKIAMMFVGLATATIAGRVEAQTTTPGGPNPPSTYPEITVTGTGTC